MRNGLPLWAATLILTLLFGVLGWNVRGIASDVRANTVDRLQREGAQQTQTIVWLENAVRGIHHEQVKDRELLNRIARELKVEEGPVVEPLPPKDPPN